MSDSDPAGDQQTSGAGTEADIVGDADIAALFKLYDGTDLAFRIRLGADSNPNGYDSAAIIGMDINGDGSLDYYIGVEIDGVGGNLKFDIGIYQFTGVASTPAETKVALASPSAQIYGYEADESNFSWESVANINNQDSDLSNDEPVDVDGEGEDDYLLSFSVPFADLVAAIGGDFDESYEITFVAITSQNLQQINNDFNGVDGTDPNSTVLWTDPGGGSSLPYSPESEGALPEPKDFALLIAAFCLFWVMGTRK
ncbi:hypothetical protein [Coraliomargarita parva]|uniref:hypothetical protein n=1 Tax=Coraliomargarita parva TaxID=3014050 RepID=UPI0022B39717|nr:hypothetical protein [Coraliomargarita parva]